MQRYENFFKWAKKTHKIIVPANIFGKFATKIYKRVTSRKNVVFLQKQNANSMVEITFTKSGEQYISNPIFGNGSSLVKYQVGYKKAGARLLLEQSFSPTDGFQLFLDKVAPAMPDYIVGTQFLPSAMYLRFRTDVNPDDVIIDVENVGGTSGAPILPEDVTEKINQIETKLEKVIVEELPVITEAKANTIYAVKNNGSEDGNLYDEYVLENGNWERLGSEHALASEDDIMSLFKN